MLIIVSFATLGGLNLPLALEAGLILLIPLSGCLLGYEVARRLGPLGLLFGVPPPKTPLSSPLQIDVTNASPKKASSSA